MTKLSQPILPKPQSENNEPKGYDNHKINPELILPNDEVAAHAEETADETHGNEHEAENRQPGSDLESAMDFSVSMRFTCVVMTDRRVSDQRW